MANQGRVDVGQLPRLHALLDHALEDGVVAAVPLFDAFLHRPGPLEVGQEQPGQLRVLHGDDPELLDDEPPEPLRGGAGPGGDDGEPPDGLLRHRPEAGGEQGLLAVEIVVQRRLGQVEAVGNLFEAGVVIALLREDFSRHPQDLVDAALALPGDAPQLRRLVLGKGAHRFIVTARACRSPKVRVCRKRPSKRVSWR